MGKNKLKSYLQGRFADLKQDLKALPLFDKIFNSLTILMMITALILRQALRPEFNAVFQIGLNVGVCFLIYLLRLIFPKKNILGGIDLKTIKYINIMILLGSFGGHFLSIYDYYQNYDSLTHLLTGVFVSIVAYYMYSFLSKDKPVKNASFCVLFCFFVTLAVALIWEMFEFGSDFLLGGFCQGYDSISPERMNEKYFYMLNWFPFAVKREAQWPLYDTFVDVYAAFIGGTITCIAMKLHLKRKLKEGTKQEIAV